MEQLNCLLNHKTNRQQFATRYIICLLLTLFVPFIGLVAIPYAIILIIWRLNSMKWSRWWALITLIPIANLILGVFLFLRKGTED